MDKNIIKYEDHIKSIKKVIERKKNKIIKLNDEVTELEIKLKSICQHINCKKINKYREAGYDYVSENIEYTICDDCGKVVKEVFTHGTSYN